MEVGVNGLITMLVSNAALLKSLTPIVLLPVVFTTADLYVTDARLNMANLTNGTVNENFYAEKVQWLWFEHNASPDLIADVQRVGIAGVNELHHLLPHCHTRGLAIVGPTGIKPFLNIAPLMFRKDLEPVD